MDAAALVSGLIGAAIGSFTSIGTLAIQNRAQNRREARRLLYETAYKDYELRILHPGEGNPQPASFPVILSYHHTMFELSEAGRLTPAAADSILEAQAAMNDALWRAAARYSGGDGVAAASG